MLAHQSKQFIPQTPRCPVIRFAYANVNFHKHNSCAFPAIISTRQRIVQRCRRACDAAGERFWGWLAQDKKGTDSAVALRLPRLEWCKTSIVKSGHGDSEKGQDLHWGEDWTPCCVCVHLGCLLILCCVWGVLGTDPRDVRDGCKLWAVISSHPVPWGSVGRFGAQHLGMGASFSGYPRTDAGVRALSCPGEPPQGRAAYSASFGTPSHRGAQRAGRPAGITPRCRCPCPECPCPECPYPRWRCPLPVLPYEVSAAPGPARGPARPPGPQGAAGRAPPRGRPAPAFISFLPSFRAFLASLAPRSPAGSPARPAAGRAATHPPRAPSAGPPQPTAAV